VLPNKHGGLVFSLSNTLIGDIYVYEKHLSIEFTLTFQKNRRKKALVTVYTVTKAVKRFLTRFF